MLIRLSRCPTIHKHNNTMLPTIIGVAGAPAVEQVLCHPWNRGSGVDIDKVIVDVTTHVYELQP